jgi:endonuclease/exonuclease/phosphatase (EEP) superfamily protein YafD
MAVGRTNTAFAVGQGFVGFGLVSIGVVGVLATILGYFGSTWWLFDFAANFRAHLAVVLTMVALAYSLTYSKATGLFFLAMAAVNALTVLPMYSSTPALAAEDGGEMTIISFNVDQRSSIRDATFRWIDSVEPDLVVLVDSTDDWVNAIEMAKPYVAQSELPIDRTFGITILSRDDVDTQVLRASRIRDSVVRIEASLGDQPIVIYAVQSRAPNNETDATYRDEYFDDVSQMVQSETLPTVVVGDFQTTPWSHAFRDLTSETGLENSMAGFGLQTTWPADRWAFFRIPVDHLLHSPELTTIDRYLGPLLGVDHRPLVVKLGLAT